MSRGQLTALHLNAPPGSRAAAALRPVLDRSLAALAALLAADGLPAAHPLAAHLEALRVAAAGPDLELLEALADECFAACDAALGDIREQRARAAAEIARLVALVRDAVSLLTTGEEAGGGLDAAVERVDALSRINDIQQLKQRLSIEILELRRVAEQRQRQWQDSLTMFESRIVSLEAQLTVARQTATVDPLTGLGNRRQFEDTMREYIQTAPRRLVLAVLDVDDFRRVNDAAGHPAGDRVLASLGRALLDASSTGDMVARTNGDEFALLSPGLTLLQAEHRWRGILRDLSAIDSGVEALPHVTLSCGLTEFSAGDTMRSILSRAGQALGEAKRCGKNRVAVRTQPFIRDLMKH